MRIAYDCALYGTPKGELMGICLGSDFTAEHEWGIDPILEMCKVNKKATGIEKFKVQNYPVASIYQKEVLFAGVPSYLFICGQEAKRVPCNYPTDVAMTKFINSTFNASNYQKEELASAWCDNTFAFIMPKKYEKEYQELITAFKKHDLMFKFSTKGIKNVLNIFIISRVPKEILNAIKNQTN